jgi:hypothetical protein
VPSSNNQVTNKAGFLTLPGQTLVEDATARSDSLFYDRGFSKWLPVGRSSVSPDGRRYAYSKIAGNAMQNTGSAIHVVDVATGVDRIIYSGGDAFTVVDFETEGVYLTTAVPEGRPRGLWLQALSGGQPLLISRTIVSPAVGGGAAWGVDFNAADPSPGPGGLEGPMNRILRYDLRSGTAVPWFYYPGANLNVMGFDANGHPFTTAGVSTRVPTVELWFIGSSGHATRLFAGEDVPAPTRLGAVDRHGMWFDAWYYASASPIWLYARGSLQVVAAANLYNLAVAGGCIP